MNEPTPTEVEAVTSIERRVERGARLLDRTYSTWFFEPSRQRFDHPAVMLKGIFFDSVFLALVMLKCWDPSTRRLNRARMVSHGLMPHGKNDYPFNRDAEIRLLVYFWQQAIAKRIELDVRL